MMKKLGGAILALAVTAMLHGCGDERPIPGQTSPSQTPLAAGTYKLAFTAISTARLDAPISGIDVAIGLPTGVSLDTTTGGGSGQIGPGALATGNAIIGTGLAFGNYSVSTHRAYLSMATTQETYRSGNFLLMSFRVEPGAVVSEYDIVTLNATYPRYKVVGMDQATHSSVVLTDRVKTTLSVIR
ncbi:MAG: hypothetical protein HYV06_10215 [Deltaproteobacteria bacterium]|nr:hypothetical protein [Deltaproteobacteria bacterium]